MRKFLHINLGFVDIDLLFIPTVFCAIKMGYIELFAVSFISVLIHECAHIILAGVLGVGISKIEIHPFGVCAVLKNGYIENSEKEFFIAFIGPFVSIFIALMALLFPIPMYEYIFSINISICVINLLPALPLDGGRMVKSMLTSRFGIIRAFGITQKSGKVLIAILIPVSILILFVTKFNFTYVLITAFLYGNIYSEQRNITMLTIRQILENTRKIENLKRTKAFAVSASEPARKILRLISYDYYIIIHISMGGKIVATLTETQVLEGLLRLGISASYEDLI